LVGSFKYHLCFQSSSISRGTDSVDVQARITIITMCNKILLPLAPCGHTWPVILKCGDPPCENTKDTDPPDAAADSGKCPNCETDLDLKEYKQAIAADPEFAEPAKPRQETSEDYVAEDEDPVKALERAMTEKPELFAHGKKPELITDKILDPAEEVNQYLLENPEQAKHQNPNAGTLFYKTKERYSFCGHFGNFHITELERNPDDDEFSGTAKGYCPGSSNMDEMQLIQDLNTITKNGDPYGAGAALGHVPGKIVHEESKKANSGNVSEGDFSQTRILAT
jgi:hypothetical protein